MSNKFWHEESHPQRECPPKLTGKRLERVRKSFCACNDCAVRWSMALETDGPRFEPCERHRAATIIGDDGDREVLCKHGVGHGPHVHTCDGCCMSEAEVRDAKERLERLHPQ